MIGTRFIAAAISRLAVLLLLVGPAAASEYVLGTDDRLRVTIYGWPELSGEVRVAADNTIALPLAGVLDVTGRTIGDLRVEIADRLASHLSARPNVTLEISRYRSVFVLGAVGEPGAYEYSPELRVLQAVALAGGSGAGAQAGDDGGLRAANIQADIDRATVEIARLQMRQARLLAEADGLDVIAPPRGVSSPLADALLAQEQRLLDTRQAAVADLLALLEVEKSHFLDEIEAIDGQAAEKRAEIDLLNEEIDRQREMVERWPALRADISDLRRHVADAESDARGIIASRARSRQQMSALDRMIADQQGRRNEEIEAELGDVLAELEAQRAELRAARVVLAGLGGGNPAVSGVSYRVKRFNGEEAIDMPVAESDMLEPGDVLLVELRFPDDQALAAPAPDPKD